MGATRVTPKEAVIIIQLYEELGTYAAVARKVGRSPTTVSKIVRMDGVPNAIRIAIRSLSNEKKVGSL